MRDRASLFVEGPVGVWRGRGVRDSTSLFVKGRQGCGEDRE